MLSFFEWLKSRIADAVSAGIVDGAARGVAAVSSGQVAEEPKLLEGNGRQKRGRKRQTARK